MADSVSMRSRVETFIVRLAKAVNTFSIYRGGHRLTQDIIRDVSGHAAQILSLRPEIVIGIIAEEIAFEKKPFIGLSARLGDFILNLKNRGFKKITFLEGLDEAELTRFITILAEKPHSDDHFENIRGTFEKEQIRHIRIGQISIEEEELLLYGISDTGGVVKKTIQKGIEVLEKQIAHVHQNESIDIESIRLVSAALVNCLFVNKSLLLMLTSIKLLDEKKYIQNLIVCVFTLLQAEILGLDKKYFMDIASAALLHNFGALTTDTEPESGQPGMTENGGGSVEGARILMETTGISPLAPLAALEADCPYDRSRALNMMYGKGLNLVSMMIAIAKDYNRLRNSPDHMGDGGVEGVYDRMLALAGKRFHADLLNNFFSAVGVFPPGTLVQLDTEEVALVIRSSLIDVRRPQVELLYDARGDRYPEKRLVSLLERDSRGRYARSIEKSIVPSMHYKIPAEILM
ncbi:MAG TPA: hypothetical protein ENN17_02655 [bacterium]|nr:hypothetical protein [bacterium]